MQIQRNSNTSKAAALRLNNQEGSICTHSPGWGEMPLTRFGIVVFIFSWAKSTGNAPQLGHTVFSNHFGDAQLWQSARLHGLSLEAQASSLLGYSCHLNCDDDQ